MLDLREPFDANNETHKKMVGWALTTLSDNCDGAHSRDGAGFNKFDVEKGKGYAFLYNSGIGLTDAQWEESVEIVQKYRNTQLEQIAFILPKPTRSTVAEVVEPKAEEEVVEPDGRLVFINSREFGVQMPNASTRHLFLDKVRDLDERYYNNRTTTWEVPGWEYEKAVEIFSGYNLVIEFEQSELDTTLPKMVVDVTDGSELIASLERDTQKFRQILSGAYMAWNHTNKSGREVYKGAEANIVTLWSGRVDQMEFTPQALRSVKFFQNLEEMKELKGREVYPEGIGGTLRRFQAQGVGYLEELFERYGKTRALIGDEPGLGKTIQVLAWLALHPELRPALVVCPSAVKENWVIEVMKWLVFDADSFQKFNALPKAISGRDPLSINNGFGVVVANYDIVEAWGDKIEDTNFKVLVLDESHYIKNTKANRTKTLRRLARQVPNVLLLSGTPITRDAKDLFTTFDVLEPGRWTEAAFNRKFGGYDTQYCRELNELLSKWMIRRKKADVLLDLPEKGRYTFGIEMEPAAFARYEKVINDALKKIADDMAKGIPNSASHLTMIEVAKQAVFEGKKTAAREWIANFLEGGEKLIVYCTHVEAVKYFCNEFPGITARIDGTVSNKQAQVDKFQNDDSCRLMVATYGAGGIGITLTAASTTVHVEFSWIAAQHQQAEDRVHRYGQSADRISAYYLYARNTIEDRIVDILIKKILLFSQIVDGKRRYEAYEDSFFNEFIGTLIAR